MVRRVTPSQWNSMVRKVQQKQRQAIDKYNREAKAYNQKANVQSMITIARFVPTTRASGLTGSGSETNSRGLAARPR